ncbi:hypothetical protein D9M68_696720 [compost metagenome]
MPAVMPAEVHTGPSLMKMRSGCTLTAGWRFCSSPAKDQCVVARRPSSRPASASPKAPVQMLVTRRALRSPARRKRHIFSDVGAMKSAPLITSVSNFPVPKRLLSVTTPDELVTGPPSSDSSSTW